MSVGNGVKALDGVIRETNNRFGPDYKSTVDIQAINNDKRLIDGKFPGQVFQVGSETAVLIKPDPSKILSFLKEESLPIDCVKTQETEFGIETFVSEGQDSGYIFIPKININCGGYKFKNLKIILDGISESSEVKSVIANTLFPRLVTEQISILLNQLLNEASRNIQEEAGKSINLDISIEEFVMYLTQESVRRANKIQETVEEFRNFSVKGISTVTSQLLFESLNGDLISASLNYGDSPSYFLVSKSGKLIVDKVTFEGKTYERSIAKLLKKVSPHISFYKLPDGARSVLIKLLARQFNQDLGINRDTIANHSGRMSPDIPVRVINLTEKYGLVNGDKLVSITCSDGPDFQTLIALFSKLMKSDFNFENILSMLNEYLVLDDAVDIMKSKLSQKRNESKDYTPDDKTLLLSLVEV
jgi:hypothetical protein